MLQLMFVCQCKPMHSTGRIDALQKDIWQRCEQKKVGGFLLRNNRSLIGVFEGAEKTIVSQVENLIRKHKVQSIEVVHEGVLMRREWMTWHRRFKTLDDVPDADEFDLVGLAQNAMDAVQADQRNN